MPDARADRPPLAKYSVVPMLVHHIPAVSAIERLSFSSAWPVFAYKREIEKNALAWYAVAKRNPAAGPPRRSPRFVAADDHEVESAGVFKRFARRLRGEGPAVSAQDVDELEAIVGYAGLWLMVDSAHVTTIAVDPPYRREGIGELLLFALINRAIELDADEMTLECRVSNEGAQALYRKYTFRNSGLRKRYYSDDGEDALIMTTDSLRSRTFQLVLEQNRERLMERMAIRV